MKQTYMDGFGSACGNAGANTNGERGITDKPLLLPLPFDDCDKCEYMSAAGVLSNDDDDDDVDGARGAGDQVTGDVERANGSPTTTADATTGSPSTIAATGVDTSSTTCSTY
jgi:hypothetical protein